MPNGSGPYLVRDEQAAEPVAHSLKPLRRNAEVPSGITWLWVLRITLLILGIAALGYYGYTLVDEFVYQAYENWSFDQQIAGRSQVDFAGFLREQTPLKYLVGEQPAGRTEPNRKQTQDVPKPLNGSVLGRLSIERLGISAMVREGVDAATLSRAVGHVPSTALAGQPGNFSIAAHRDTLFRALKNIHFGDQVVFQSATGTYPYRVISTQIVRPSDVSVLRSDGGPRLVQQVAGHPARLLTMITCYPFNYIGSAPQRFIVQAEAVRGVEKPAAAAARVMPPAVRTRTKAVAKHRPANPPAQHQRPNKSKKKGFWRTLFSNS